MKYYFHTVIDYLCTKLRPKSFECPDLSPLHQWCSGCLGPWDMLRFIQCFQHSLQWYFIIGNWEWKDFGFCHSYYRTASEERRKAEEDASEAQIVFILRLFSSCIFWSRLGWTRGSMLLSMWCCVFLTGWRLGDHSHKRASPSDQWGDGALHWEIPTVYVSPKRAAINKN